MQRQTVNIQKLPRTRLAEAYKEFCGLFEDCDIEWSDFRLLFYNDRVINERCFLLIPKMEQGDFSMEQLRTIMELLEYPQFQYGNEQMDDPIVQRICLIGMDAISNDPVIVERINMLLELMKLEFSKRKMCNMAHLILWHRAFIQEELGIKIVKSTKV